MKLCGVSVALCQIILAICYYFHHHRVQVTSRGRAGRTVGRGRAPRGRGKLAAASGPDDHMPHPQHVISGSDQFVITEFSHLCGYPDCGKRFRFKHDLLRHQTKYHGRQPVNRKSSGRPAVDDDMTVSAGSDQFVITEVSHLCGYPDCGKRFRFKHDLLRHQTKYHGREPVKRKSSGLQAVDDDMTGYFDE